MSQNPQRAIEEAEQSRYLTIAQTFFDIKCCICGMALHKSYFAHNLSKLPKDEFQNYLLFCKDKGAMCCNCYRNAKSQNYIIPLKLAHKEFTAIKKQLIICPICGKKGKLQKKRVKYTHRIYTYPYMAHFNGKLTWCYIPVGMMAKLAIAYTLKIICDNQLIRKGLILSKSLSS